MHSGRVKGADCVPSTGTCNTPSYPSSWRSARGHQAKGQRGRLPVRVCRSESAKQVNVPHTLGQVHMHEDRYVLAEATRPRPGATRSAAGPSLPNRPIYRGCRDSERHPLVETETREGAETTETKTTETRKGAKTTETWKGAKTAETWEGAKTTGTRKGVASG